MRGTARITRLKYSGFVSRTVGTCSELICDEEDFSRLNYADGSFDLIVSSIAIHHLDATSKQSLFRRISDWLRRAGFPVVDRPWRYLLWSVNQARK